MSLPVDNYKGVFDKRLGFGKKPAVLVVDFVKAYVTEGSPLWAPQVPQAVRHTVSLVQIARNAGVPVIFTKVQYAPNLLDGGLFAKKIPALNAFIKGSELGDLVDELSPEACDLLVNKQYASAFFGTSLQSTLVSLGVDTIILCGCSTSGCIRASAVDGIQHGFRVIVPRECVADRDPVPHEANLFDIDAKYGDVMSLSEVVERIGYLQSGRSMP